MCLQFRMEFLCSEDEEGNENWVKVHVPKWMQEAIDDRDFKKLQESCFDVKAHICKYAYFSRFMQFYKHLMVHSGNPWSVLELRFSYHFFRLLFPVFCNEIFHQSRSFLYVFDGLNRK